VRIGLKLYQKNLKYKASYLPQPQSSLPQFGLVENALRLRQIDTPAKSTAAAMMQSTIKFWLK